MLASQENILIDHLDKTLHDEQLKEVEALILNDKEFAEQWGYLQLAVKGIEYTGLIDRVALAGKEFEAQKQSVVKSSPAVVRSIYRNVMRVAACILLLAGSAMVYKYMTLSSEGLYNKYYFSYDLNTTRGTETIDKLEQAYRDHNWLSVLNLFNASVEKNNKYYFLSGMACMELKKYDLAITDFKQIITANTASGDNYFGDEAEYYLAMSLIGNNEASLAVPILNQIKGNPSHLYYEKANSISGLDLRIIQLKDRK